MHDDPHATCRRCEQSRQADEVTRLLSVIRGLLRYATAPGDWACAECRPYSDMLKDGFRCAYHEARALSGLEPVDAL
jgi:hypothetical protein